MTEASQFITPDLHSSSATVATSETGLEQTTTLPAPDSSEEPAENIKSTQPPNTTLETNPPSTLNSLTRNMKLPDFDLPSLSKSIPDISLASIFSNMKLPESQPTSSSTTSEPPKPQFPPLDASLPQPVNANHPATAPLTDKIISNSAYLRAEIPNKLGHWVTSLWTDQNADLALTSVSAASSSEISSKTPSKDPPSTSAHPTFVTTAGDWLTTKIALAKQLAGLEQAPVAPNPFYLLGEKYNPLPTILLNDTSEKESILTIPLVPSDPPVQRAPSPPPLPMYPNAFLEDFQSRLYFTYRHNFPPIRPSERRTDIGWGCMLRSAQSVLGNALIIHLLGRKWRKCPPNDPVWYKYREIVHWFLDELSPRSPYSIHRIALLGKQYGKEIGEWFGPSTAAGVIKALVLNHPPSNLTVHISTDGVVYKNEVYDCAAGRTKKAEFYIRSDGEISETEHLDIKEDTEMQSTKGKEGLFKAVLILIPIRLGVEKLNPVYYNGLRECLQIKQSVGIAGGRPNSSLYFTGVHGDELFYMDPHHSRPALETKELDDYTDEDLSGYHCTLPRKIHISHLDPSMLLAFYVHNRDEFETFCDTVHNISTRCTAIFSIAEQAPGYEDDVRSEEDWGVLSGEENEDEESEKSEDELKSERKGGSETEEDSEGDVDD